MNPKLTCEQRIDLLVNARGLRHNTRVAERRRIGCAPTKATLLDSKTNHPALINQLDIIITLNPFSLGEEWQNQKLPTQQLKRRSEPLGKRQADPRRSLQHYSGSGGQTTRSY